VAEPDLRVAAARLVRPRHRRRLECGPHRKAILRYIDMRVFQFALVEALDPGRPLTRAKVNRAGRPASKLCTAVAFRSDQAIIAWGEDCGVRCRTHSDARRARETPGRPRAGSDLSLFDMAVAPVRARVDEFSTPTKAEPQRRVPARAARFQGDGLKNSKSRRICASPHHHRHRHSAGTAKITAVDELGSRK
jgi:hypothetical protein